MVLCELIVAYADPSFSFLGRKTLCQVGSAVAPPPPPSRPFLHTILNTNRRGKKCLAADCFVDQGWVTLVNDEGQVQVWSTTSITPRLLTTLSLPSGVASTTTFQAAFAHALPHRRLLLVLQNHPPPSPQPGQHRGQSHGSRLRLLVWTLPETPGGSGGRSHSCNKIHLKSLDMADSTAVLELLACGGPDRFWLCTLRTTGEVVERFGALLDVRAQTCEVLWRRRETAPAPASDSYVFWAANHHCSTGRQIRNHSRHAPTPGGMVVILDVATGVPRAMVDGAHKVTPLPECNQFAALTQGYLHIVRVPPRPRAVPGGMAGRVVEVSFSYADRPTLPKGFESVFVHRLRGLGGVGDRCDVVARDPLVGSGVMILVQNFSGGAVCGGTSFLFGNNNAGREWQLLVELAPLPPILHCQPLADRSVLLVVEAEELRLWRLRPQGRLTTLQVLKKSDSRLPRLQFCLPITERAAVLLVAEDPATKWELLA